MKPCICVVALAYLTVTACAIELPAAGEQVTVTLPDFGAELRAFDDPETSPVSWWPHVINAAWGGGRGGPERTGGWLDSNWQLVDYLDRSADYTTHEYLTHRGIWYEVYGSNEYQETIHFHEDGARKLLWDNGIAQDMNGERVLSEHYNTSVDWWNEKIGWDAYIVCNNAPRWWAVINYDWLTSPLLGHAISQDNIGGPTSRIGAGGHGRYCDYCNARFFHYLTLTNRLPEFRRDYKHIRDYVQGNLMDVVSQLPPAVKHRFNEEEAELLARMCAPPVMSEYQKSLYLSHLHNLVRNYRDAKLVAARQRREYDVHGNQGGGFVGPNPYQIALADFVDTVWFETSGMSAYDMFKYHWNNAWGAFRYEMGRAMTRGQKPFMSMTGFQKHTRDIVEHELAECCAGGGVLFVNQEHFVEEPELQQLMTDYFRFRHDHRALFADAGKRRHAQIALAYSIPTMMYYNYQHAAAAAPLNALSGMARALEEGHLPFDVVTFNHPEVHADRVTLDELKGYRLVILPALECLTDAQITLFTDYLRAGGTLGIIGDPGVRNEDNLPREEAPLATWQAAGRVVEILPGRNFLPNRATESDATRELTEAAVSAVRDALGGEMLVSGDLPRLLWVKTWQHGEDCVSVHFVNYDIDFESGEATPTQPVDVTIALPAGVPPEEAVWLTPTGEPEDVEMSADGQTVKVEIPSVRVYGVLLIGHRGLDAKRSAVLHGDAMLARAQMASGGAWGELADQAAAVEEASRRCAEGTATVDEAEAYARAAGDLLRAVQEAQDSAYFERAETAASMDELYLFDFGAAEDGDGWRAVTPESLYSPEAGFGWLPPEDDSEPTPEELYYAMAEKHGSKFVDELSASRILFWPYKKQPPKPLQTNIACGTPRSFRVDLDPGRYVVRVVTTCPSWTNRNFLVSGMVSVNGGVRLLDAVHDKGAIVARQFQAAADPEGKLVFTFGGPTGWGVSALTLRPVPPAAPTPPQPQSLRTWRVSPRYANPDWYPITQVSAPPEQHLADLPEEGWTLVEAPAEGISVVDLGTNREAEIGDVVYAAATINAEGAREAALHFGASSQAQLWLNGEPLGYVPNEKGVRRDEFVAPIRLRAGENTLVVKLQRFWDRHWMFYAELTEG